MNMKDFDMNKPASEVEEAAFSSGSVEDGEAIINEDEASTSRSKKLQLSKEQSKLLEESFRQSPIPGHKEKEELASKLNLRQRQVKVWFQNRRARTKLKQMENECQYLKRCSTSLKEENRKLQLELQKLCALCMSHNHMTTFAPPLAMCARCQCFITHSARES